MRISLAIASFRARLSHLVCANKATPECYCWKPFRDTNPYEQVPRRHHSLGGPCASNISSRETLLSATWRLVRGGRGFCPTTRIVLGTAKFICSASYPNGCASSTAWAAQFYTRRAPNRERSVLRICHLIGKLSAYRTNLDATPAYLRVLGALQIVRWSSSVATTSFLCGAVASKGCR